MLKESKLECVLERSGGRIATEITSIVVLGYVTCPGMPIMGIPCTGMDTGGGIMP